MSALINFSFASFLLWFLIFIFLFFIIREIVLWYFKINKAVDSLDRIANSLEIIASSDEEITIEKEPVVINQLTTEPEVTKPVVTEVVDEGLNQTEK